jgi:hypothetical protein
MTNCRNSSSPETRYSSSMWRQTPHVTSQNKLWSNTLKCKSPSDAFTVGPPDTCYRIACGFSVPCGDWRVAHKSIFSFLGSSPRWSTQIHSVQNLLGEFTKFRKATFNFFMSVRPSV